jgi:lipopolysaccharide transport system ATP-binding protein
MSTPVISVRNIGKKYKLGATLGGRNYKTLRDVLTKAAFGPIRKLSAFFRKEPSTSDKHSSPNNPITQLVNNSITKSHNNSNEFWALKDISFDVQQGEVIGIIGANGAGKSTLLKILCGITEPTEGEIHIKGRIASLLEVGTGFHPELSGRENIFMNGAILGMTKFEIQAKFDEIVAFAEVEKFIDTPVKRYSSGMYVRLAFAVASHLEPEILMVDEVLAVGDAEFQKKCLWKMGDVSKGGRTVLFVSHNMIAVNNLCQKAILLDEGRLICHDDVSKVVEKYLSTERDLNGEHVWDSLDNAPGNHQVRLRAVRITSDGCSNGSPPVEKDIEIQIDYWNLEKNGRIVDDPWVQKNYPVGLFRTKCIIPKFLLNSGRHSIDLYINGRMGSDNIILKKNIITFDVQEANEIRKGFQGKWIGAVRPILDWKTTQLEEDIPER